MRYAPPVAAAPALTAELQSFVDHVETLLARGRECARSEAEVKAAAEVEEQFRARVVPFANRCREMLFRGADVDDDVGELDKLGAMAPVTTKLVRPQEELPAQESEPDVQKQPEGEVESQSEPNKVVGQPEPSDIPNQEQESAKEPNEATVNESNTDAMAKEADHQEKLPSDHNL